MVATTRVEHVQRVTGTTLSTPEKLQGLAVPHQGVLFPTVSAVLGAFGRVTLQHEVAHSETDLAHATAVKGTTVTKLHLSEWLHTVMFEEMT